MNNFLIAIGIFVVIISVAGFYNLILFKKNLNKVEVVINGMAFDVEVADTAVTQARGLSGRSGLEENKGMLFLFNSFSRRSFWMRGMKFSLDIIWINEKRIVDIDKNVPPPANGVIDFKMYSPSQPVDKVLEINAGLSEKYNIKIGDNIEIK